MRAQGAPNRVGNEALPLPGRPSAFVASADASPAGGRLPRREEGGRLSFGAVHTMRDDPVMAWPALLLRALHAEVLTGPGPERLLRARRE